MYQDFADVCYVVQGVAAIQGQWIGVWPLGVCTHALHTYHRIQWGELSRL